MNNDVEKKKAIVNPPKPKITSLMIMCFINEFCVKWSLNAFESRYGIYISDRWNVSSPVYSYVIYMSREMRKVLSIELGIYNGIVYNRLHNIPIINQSSFTTC